MKNTTHWEQQPDKAIMHNYNLSTKYWTLWKVKLYVRKVGNTHSRLSMIEELLSKIVSDLQQLWHKYFLYFFDITEQVWRPLVNIYLVKHLSMQTSTLSSMETPKGNSAASTYSFLLKFKTDSQCIPGMLHRMRSVLRAFHCETGSLSWWAQYSTERIWPLMRWKADTINRNVFSYYYKGSVATKKVVQTRVKVKAEEIIIQRKTKASQRVHKP